MLSMTGFGRAGADAAGRRLVIEVRAVNHRFLDLKLRLPWGGAELEARIGAAVRKRVDRGALSINISEDAAARAPAVHANLPLAMAIHAALVELADALGAPPPGLDAVLAQPGVLVVGEPTTAIDELWAALEPALDAALVALAAERAREGAALAADVLARVANLERLAAELGRLAAAGPEAARKRLTDRLAKLLGEGQVDPQRLAQEVALLADKADVSEELTRLTAHLGELRALCSAPGPVGRKLDFLLQEVGREINTTGSKSQATEIARLIVDAKAELEKIREQIQNVE